MLTSAKRRLRDLPLLWHERGPHSIGVRQSHVAKPLLWSLWHGASRLTSSHSAGWICANIQNRPTSFFMYAIQFRSHFPNYIIEVVYRDFNFSTYLFMIGHILVKLHQVKQPLQGGNGRPKLVGIQVGVLFQHLILLQ